MQSGLLFTTSPWFTLLCVAAGALYAWLLYNPIHSWGRTTTLFLATLRTILVATICFLLLGPRVRSTGTSLDKAKVVLAVDNSGSMKETLSDGLITELASLQTALTNAGYEVATFTLDDSNQLDSLSFNEGSTDLSRFLNRIKQGYESRNLTDVLLISDGIVNQGSSPAFNIYPYKIHTIAVGDTLPASDIRITRITANQVAFLGNQFPIQVDISAYGLHGRQATLTLKQGAATLSTKPIKVSGENYFETVEFQASSREKGIQRYTVELNIPNETSYRQEVYIDIIDGRENILLLALAPHPDLKTIRTILNQNENYELDIHTLATGTIPESFLRKKYDLVILHQLPDLFNLGNNQLLTTILSEQTPVWFIYGNQSAPAPFNRINRNVTIIGDNSQFDHVTGSLNKSFKSALLASEKFTLLDRMPPLSVPFGEYTLAPGAETVLFQRIGTLDTQKPLLTVNTSDGARKTATFLGDGLWRWRMEEYSQTEKTEVIDELVLKLVQLLALKEDKRKFRVTPTAREFTSREPVVLQTEVYNDLYERIYGQEISLKITNDQGQTSDYSYVNLEEQPAFRISGLKEGAYHFVASTHINGKPEQTEGRFLVRDIDLESLNMTADHGMLRELSAKTGGRFLHPEQLEELTTQLTSSKSPDRLEHMEEVLEIIHLKWLFFLLIVLAASEWAIRKYLGDY